MILLLLARSAFPQELPSDKIIIRPEFSPQESANSGEPGVALAISGGGARGLAVIGVLKALERENIKIKFIAGVSMGSVIGGLYACGYSAKEIEDIAHRIDWGDLFSPAPLRTALLPTQKGQAEKSLFTIRFQGLRPVIPKAITSGQKLSQMLEQLTARGGIRSNISYNYLTPQIRIICTDLLTGERVVLSSGSLSEAMRASIAVPVAFTPVEKDGRLLVDGGLVDPIPVDIAAEESGCPVVAVDVTSDLLPQSKIVDIVDIADQTTTIMSMEKKREALAIADLYIAPDLGGRTAGDFSDIDSLIMLAERATEKAIPSIKRLLADTGRHPENYPAHHIAQTDIAGLGSMPRTFFATSIRGDSVMTRAEVEDNLRQAYDSGYLTHAWAEIYPESGGCRLIYHLEDNPRISDVKIQGATIVDSRELFKIIRTQRGTVLNHNLIQRDRKAIEDHYIDAGYSLVRATALFDIAGGFLVYKIDEGRINRIEIEGTKKTRKWVVSRHLPFSEGDIFEQERARQAIEEIFATGLFESAKLVAMPDSEGITLVVKVAEKPYNLIRGGARYDLEYQSRGFIDVVADNVFGGGQQMFLSANIGEKRRSLAINFQSDRIFKTLFTNNLRIDYGELKLNQYLDHEYTGYLKQTSYGIELTPGRQIPQLGTIMIVGQARKYRWNEPGKLEKLEFTKISVGIKSLVDSRDALSFPDHGKYHVFELQFAGNIHDEKTAYTRFFSSLEAYYTITRRLNFHPRLTVGASSDFMPYFDEFSLGGLDNFLGLYEDEHLGDKLLLGSLEMRQKIGDRFYVLARYNAGNIWNKLETVQLSKLIHGGGAGMAFKTPLGPVEAWYGRTDDGLDAFYFNIGYRW